MQVSNPLRQQWDIHLGNASELALLDKAQQHHSGRHKLASQSQVGNAFCHVPAQSVLLYQVARCTAECQTD